MHIQPKEPREYPWFLKPFFRSQKKRYGQVLLPGLLWGRQPLLFTTVALLYGALDRRSSPLDPVLRSLVTVRVSQINWCAFCVDINSQTLLTRSGARDKLDQLDRWQQSEAFSERERAALAYTECMTRSDQRMDAAVMAELKRHFDDDAVVDLTGLIAFQNLSSKFNEALDVPAQGFCRIPPAPSKDAT